MGELIKCGVCEKEFSSAAKQCPHCGQPNIVCPKCGSKDLHERTGREKGRAVFWFGVLGAQSAMMNHKCKNCGFKF